LLLFAYRYLHAVAQINVPYLYCEAHMLAIRLPQAIEKRLEKLARCTGRSKSFYVREAILLHIEDLEDIYLAERTLQRIRDGEERVIPLEDILNRRGMED
jgi:RHH-type rel operon transcriptional repressor/antitoxin RelB